MRQQHPFKWRHFEADIILLCVQWYVRYPLSYCDLEEMMRERGLSVDHTTIYRWVQYYAPELKRRCRPYLKLTNDSQKGHELDRSKVEEAIDRLTSILGNSHISHSWFLCPLIHEEHKEMIELNMDALIVTDDERKLKGVVDREQVLSKLMLAVNKSE